MNFYGMFICLSYMFLKDIEFLASLISSGSLFHAVQEKWFHDLSSQNKIILSNGINFDMHLAIFIGIYYFKYSF